MTGNIQVLGVRLLRLILVVVGITLIVFLMLELIPGDPAQAILGNTGSDDPAALEALREEMGLNDPLIARYASWLGGVLQGDLGSSFLSRQSVLDAILARLPVTLHLILMTEIVSLLVVIPTALYVALRRDGWMDRTVATLSFATQAVPNYVVAILSILLFSVTLGWLPALGYVPFAVDPVASTLSLVIPVIALSSTIIPAMLRVLRAELIRTLQDDHVLVARAMGAPRKAILSRYVFRPALPTLLTVIGVNVGVLIGGTVVIEVISGIPGIGTLLLNAINNWDYLMVQGIVLFIAIFYVMINFAVDIANVAVDPRLRRSE